MCEMWRKLPNILKSPEDIDIEKIGEIIKKNLERIDEEIVDGFNILQYFCGADIFYGLKYRKICDYSTRYQIIKLLLELGANVNKECNHFEYTPLIIFCGLCHEDMRFIDVNDRKDIILILKLLLNFGADPNLKSTHVLGCKGASALHYLLMGYSFYVRGRDYDKIIIEMVEILIKSGADVNSIDNSGYLIIEYFLGISLSTDNREIIDEIAKIMLKNGLNMEKIRRKNRLLSLLFTYQLENENERLKKEIEELKYRPGNPGYQEVMENFDKLAGIKK